MKNALTPFLLLALALPTGAQQLFNTTFDGQWTDCYPWESGATATSARGTQPRGWCISNVSNTAMPIVGEAVEPGADGTGKAVKLSNVSVMGQNAPGYMSLGTAWATAETKMTTVRNADGGVFGGIPFTWHPDAVRFTYKHDVSSGAENMSVIAYLWKGTWTQQDVPSNTAVGVFSYGTATKVTMTDRIQNILGKPCLMGGDITHTDDAALIASAEYYSSDAVAEWQTMELPLDYGDYAGKPVDVEKLNIVVAANGLFDDRNAIKSGNSLTIDDVELVYYHSLAALAYEGTQFDFAEDVVSYDLSSVRYDAQRLSFTVKGQAATADTNYDEETGVLTIRVEGEDFAANASSFTEYRIQFSTEPEVEKAVPAVSATQTELFVDDCTTLNLVNCDGLTAEYTTPGVVLYEDGMVTALSAGTTTLILTQPETPAIKGGVFEIEFTVSRHDVVWTWNADVRQYAGSVVENAFVLTSGDTSLLTISSSDESIARIEDGSLIIGDQPGTATITVRSRTSVKWNPRTETYDVAVITPGHVPFDLTQTLYNTLKGQTQGGQAWDANSGIRLGNSSEIFSWGEKFYVMKLSGIPDKLSFSYSSSTGASGREYVIYESADGSSFTETWRDNKGSGFDANTYRSGDIQLKPDTRFVKFYYYGNCAAYYRDVRVTELVKFEADTDYIHMNETEHTASFTFTHANAREGVITVTSPSDAVSVTVEEMEGGMDVYGAHTVSLSYDVNVEDVDDYIVISNGEQSVQVRVVARLEDPDAIHAAKESQQEQKTYNLSGQRVGRMQKGINIVGGRKVLK